MAAEKPDGTTFESFFDDTTRKFYDMHISNIAPGDPLYGLQTPNIPHTLENYIKCEWLARLVDNSSLGFNFNWIDTDHIDDGMLISDRLRMPKADHQTKLRLWKIVFALLYDDPLYKVDIEFISRYLMDIKSKESPFYAVFTPDDNELGYLI